MSQWEKGDLQGCVPRPERERAHCRGAHCLDPILAQRGVFAEDIRSCHVNRQNLSCFLPALLSLCSFAFSDLIEIKSELFHWTCAASNSFPVTRPINIADREVQAHTCIFRPPRQRTNASASIWHQRQSKSLYAYPICCQYIHHIRPPVRASTMGIITSETRRNREPHKLCH